MNERACCFLGHRKIEITDLLEMNLRNAIKRLIVEEKIETFLFGSKSQFNDLCYQIVSELKSCFPNVKRIYVRAQSPYINEDYKAYLLEKYEETYYPKSALNSGKSSYIKRNFEMIDKSRFCIVYFDKNYIPTARSKISEPRKNSGTRIAYDYATKKNKIVINLFEEK